MNPTNHACRKDTLRDRARVPRRRLAVAIAILATLLTTVGFTPASLAGMPSHTRLLLKSVEIESCEPLSDGNAEKVTRAIAERADPEQARRAARRIAADHTGWVVDVRVLRERTVTFSLLRPSEEPTDDTGWQPVEETARTRVFYVPERAGTGCDALTPGSRWSLTQDPRIECDTAPPVGLCVFDAVALPTRAQMKERYGEP